MKINPILIITLGIILTLITPYLFTQFHTYISFGKSNEIGDTIGGITSPIIGLMGAILVYFALNEQINANRLIQIQLQREQDKEKEQLNKIKRLIIYDLKNHIIEETKLFKSDLHEYFNKHNSKKLNPPFKFREYIFLNSNLFDSLPKTEIYSAFTLNNADFTSLIEVYKRVNYISNYDTQSFHNKITTAIKEKQHDTDLIQDTFQLQLNSINFSIDFILQTSHHIVQEYSKEVI